MKRQRHYVNYLNPGDTGFITTTALDWAPVFSRPSMALRMCDLLFEVHAHHKAALHAFVVMPEHLHFITKLPHDMSGSVFIDRLKSYSAIQLTPLLNERERDALGIQTGLNRRSFWQRSFRGFAIDSDELWLQKLEYIHLNPCRRNLCESAEAYPWSSARMFVAVLWDEVTGLRREDWLQITAAERGVQASTAGAAEASSFSAHPQASTAGAAEAFQSAVLANEDL